MDELEDVSALGAERRVVLERSFDVVEAAQCEEVVALVEVERRLLAHATEHRVRIELKLRVIRVVVDLVAERCRHRSPLDTSRTMARGASWRPTGRSGRSTKR